VIVCKAKAVDLEFSSTAFSANMGSYTARLSAAAKGVRSQNSEFRMLLLVKTACWLMARKRLHNNYQAGSF